MAEGKEKQQSTKKPKVPPEALEHVWREIERLGDSALDVEKVGRFCYITHAGSPLCRLGYRGELEIWDFAIYRHSRQAYDPDVEIFPLFGKVGECVRKALDAYNLT